MSDAEGGSNNTTSSAYMEIRWSLDGLDSGCNSPASSACENKKPRTSIARIKSMAERGSPCLSPL
ncbi:DnaJ/Hsp40 cysteine-rich domain superfamily protein [Zea mays]|uniref:DnaJ/Hsp40 cysteine-rich domain superfamily protein n=1 Tax=Zea mays TaxID=4577 RepID=A0A1D6KZ62_MAIZE|nr:DnaJ/Hsp40 cysteine-rich domain superfamily protein [Zea mays]